MYAVICLYQAKYRHSETILGTGVLAEFFTA